MIGGMLGHYRVLAKLGEGGMGRVYAAEDTTLGRRVALKVLPEEMAADPDRLQRFQREARAVAALNHPNIVTIYSVEEVDGVQFLTMELVEGKTLGDAIPAAGLLLDAFLKLAVPLAEAVAFAHEHGIVHRDLKPANIMLTDDGRLKVLDFGLAKLKPEVSSTETTCFATQLTGAQVVLGTLAYMSPEQAEGRPVDHRSDIFALGVVLYEMACGRRPFQGETAFALISSIIKDRPSVPSSVNRAVPPVLDRIITRALAKDPAERYQSARDMCDELEQVQAQTASLRVVSNLVRVIARSRWTRHVVVAAALVVLAAAAALYLAPWRSRPDRSAPTGVPAATFDRLTTTSGVEQFPSLTPDGKWVVYAGQQSGNMDLYLLSTTGQIPRNLTPDSPADDDQPAVSPDGERIAFRSSRDGGGIWVMGITGEEVKRVTPASVSEAFNPAWSPDGTEIAYDTENVQLAPLNIESRNAELWIVNATTGVQRKLEVTDAVQPAWSPHGHRIAYVARTQTAGFGGRAATRSLDISTVPVAGGQAVPVTRDEPTDWSPVWSPDGHHLYFASDRGGSMNLWRVAIDEVSGKPLADPQQITTPAPYLAHPSVSADGQLIAYCAKTDTGPIWKITLDPATAAVQGEPTWVTSGSQAWANPDPSPDGKWIVAYTRDQPEGDLYVMPSDGAGLPRQLTADSAIIDRLPRWSPDQRWIAFFSSRGGPLSVWKVRFDGSDLQQVADAQSSYPVWSPDGARLAVHWSPAAGVGGKPVTRLVDANRAWQAQTPEDLQDLPLLGKGLGFSAQDWSPDGTRLAFQIGSTGAARGIVIYTFASRAYERLTDFGEWPVWLPDSRRVLFVANAKDYWVVDTRTKQTQKIWTVPNGRLGPARLTRDGRTAYFSRRMTEADVYLLKFEAGTGPPAANAR